jgi:hypothetical protein
VTTTYISPELKTIRAVYKGISDIIPHEWFTWNSVHDIVRLARSHPILQTNLLRELPRSHDARELLKSYFTSKGAAGLYQAPELVACAGSIVEFVRREDNPPNHPGLVCIAVFLFLESRFAGNQGNIHLLTEALVVELREGGHTLPNTQLLATAAFVRRLLEA